MQSEQVAQIDSKDMDHATWQRLALRCEHWSQASDVDGLVITHGTDTIEETAFFLSSVLKPHCPVVLTCAMRPASSASPDGPQNMVDAMVVAADGDADGVSVVCAGVIHSALDVRKVHTYRPDAFDSGERGPIGFVEEGLVRWVRRAALSERTAEIEFFDALAPSIEWPRVEIVTSHAGADGALVDALIAGSIAGGGITPIAGLVVAATGNGTLHRGLLEALLRAVEKGIAVRVATRCPLGIVLGLAGRPFQVATDLSPFKARIALMLDLLRDRF